MRTRSLGVFLAVWSFGFACVHVAWALGWEAGLPADAAPISERPWFLAYDLFAGLLMYAAAGVALLLAGGGLPHRTTGLLATATMVGSWLALARGVPALAYDLGTGTVSGVGFLADVWFTVAGAAGLVLWRVTAPGVRAAAEITARG